MYQGKFDKNRKQAAISARTDTPAKPVPTKVKRKLRLSGVIFYTVFFLVVFLFYTATYLGLLELRDWLVRYELAQPDQKGQEVFEEIFLNANWGDLYETAGVQDTVYESKDVFIRYMEDVVNGDDLSYMGTSAGLSGRKKYIVRLGDRKIATFTLEDHNTSEDELSIPDWQLGEVDLYIDRNESVRVKKAANHTVYVNGIALNDSHTIQVSTTVADEYLPSGMVGTGMCVQELTGLIAVPTVKILDENGTEMPVIYDEASRTFVEQMEKPTISEQEQSLALQALETYSLYMMRQASGSDIAKYYKKSSNAYNSITDTERGFVQDASAHEFVNETVSDYCRYSDTLFSVRVSVVLNQYRSNGSVKESTIEQSMFFEKQSSAKWLCIEMTGVDISKPVEQVRLTFMNGENTLSSDFYDVSAHHIACPQVPVPHGKVFSGWMTKETAPNGDTVMQLIFQPDESGVVSIQPGMLTGPMTLHPMFNNKG